MINFRYHLVSLTAVFLALAVGLVLGTAALNGPAADLLQDQVSSLRSQNDTYRDNLEQLEQQLDDEEEFAKALAPTVLPGRLTDRTVLVASLAGVDEEAVTGTLEMLGYSGAVVTGQLEFTDNFTDPAKNDELLDLSKSLLPKNVTNLPNNSDGVETASALLAAVLMAGGPEVTPEERTKVFAGFVEAQMILDPEKIGDGRAVAVLIMAPKPYVEDDAEVRNKDVVTLAAQFDTGGSALLAVPAIGGDGNAVAAVRNDPALTTTLSTVDNISTAQGQLTACLALAADLAGRPGDYGTGAGAESIVPPAPGA